METFEEELESQLKISFAILTKNETVSLSALLDQLEDLDVRYQHEIVVLDDYSDKETLDIIQSRPGVKFVQNALNGDFAAQKNTLNSLCVGDWIFNVDADELISPYLLEMLGTLIVLNQDIDLFFVPRINKVEGITQEDINRWNWRVNESGYINFPDWQGRFYRNSPDIKWTRPVHEVITGGSKVTFLPAEELYAIFHIKDIERQRRQNDFYETI